MAILTITVHKTVADRHYFRLRDIGGGLLLTSKDYDTISKCLNEIYILQAYRDFVMEEEGLKGSIVIHCRLHGEIRLR